MIEICREEGLLHYFLVEKINEIRLKRNPFTHPKSYDHLYSVVQRSLEEKIDAEDLLEQDAKNAIDLMYSIIET